MLAVDLHRRVVVFLPIMDLVPPDGGTPHAASAPWWGMNGSSAAPTSIRWLDYSSTIPVTITVSDDSVSRTLPCTVKSLVYLSSLDRLAIILRASYSGTNPGALSGDDANPTEVVSVFHFSSVLRQWVHQSSMKIFRTTAGIQDYAVLPLQDLLGGGWLLYPTLPSSSLVGMAMIVYDVSSFNTFTTCDTSRGLAISRDGTSCYVCASRQVATIDGFCTDEKKNISDCHECHWVIPFAAAVGASIFIVLVVMLLIHMFRTSWSQKARITTLRERSTKFTNAPPSGRTPILTLMIVDADVLWQTGGENLLEAEEYTTKHRSSSIDDATTNGTTEQNSEINSKGKRHHREKASTEFVLRILDSLHKSLCGSIAANNGYLAEYRGEVAVVVHNNPAALMCIALEASLAMALHQPPVRLAVALHIGNVVRSVDVKGTKKCVFAGEGMNVAARIASLSATTGGFVSGAWMASQQFVAKLMDESPGAMKALALSRGATSQIRYENIVTEVQEITSALLVDALGDQTSFDLARQRRTKHLKELRNNTKAATMAAKTSDLKKHHATEGGTRPRTVHYALHARRSSDGTHGENETTHFAVDVSDAPPHQNQQTQVENPLSPQQHFSTALTWLCFSSCIGKQPRRIIDRVVRKENHAGYSWTKCKCLVRLRAVGPHSGSADQAC
ncbi:transmembrane protein, putative [Bodo saltans]|uniref:Transmembrane protein, putative n=1 Tax=Bodo saltans TaxID=75058 RepID=A0A0S4JJY2_BODSA|nr:transmembrane protein, putative [Bodo saltans]|eukprot:CUG90671.1 transmembrane protein, putative [Bodo saltans]